MKRKQWIGVMAWCLAIGGSNLLTYVWSHTPSPVVHADAPTPYASKENILKMNEYMDESEQYYRRLYHFYQQNAPAPLAKNEKIRVVYEFVESYFHRDPKELLKWIEGDKAMQKWKQHPRLQNTSNDIRQIVCYDPVQPLKECSPTQVEVTIIRNKLPEFDRFNDYADRMERFDTYREKWVIQLKKKGNTYKVIDWSIQAK
ncbi:hypothetical protein ACPVTF_07185 [Geobacillus icigianus]|uniref:Uncharacterized protein n=1 Tax=Geobacillus subterraneus TaxID=129338 RepID=A0A679FQU5_9BACL|nr:MULTISPECIES: hypothetical protein [Geobacillus]BBW96627.1 hypothetical protein GsuE55_14600 [Geobacillus subterraneus]